MSVEDGWFKRQCEDVDKEVSSWPEWMQRQAFGEEFVEEEKRKKRAAAIQRIAAGFKDLKPRDPKRIPEVLEAIREYWEQNPDLRLGQIIAGISHDRHNTFDPFNLEDDTLLDSLEDKKSS